VSIIFLHRKQCAAFFHSWINHKRKRWFQNDLNIFLYLWQLIKNNQAINSRGVYAKKARKIRTKLLYKDRPDVQENLPDPFC